MPIYEFYCQDCNTIFNFFSRRINTVAQPDCPKCNRTLQRQMSIFSTVGKDKESGDDGIPDIDEEKVERVLSELAHEVENIKEDDPKQMARVMRKFSEKSGLHLGDGMEEAMARLEAGEDPEQIEQEMGDILEGDDPFTVEGKKAKKKVRSSVPIKDETLYEL